VKAAKLRPKKLFRKIHVNTSGGENPGIAKKKTRGAEGGLPKKVEKIASKAARMNMGKNIAQGPMEGKARL